MNITQIIAATAETEVTEVSRTQQISNLEAALAKLENIGRIDYDLALEIATLEVVLDMAQEIAALEAELSLAQERIAYLEESVKDSRPEIKWKDESWRVVEHLG